jgi:hypothetical protein
MGEQGSYSQELLKSYERRLAVVCKAEGGILAGKLVLLNWRFVRRE